MRVQNLCKTYHTQTGEDVHALNGISFDLPETGVVAILGKSGSGKSTLLNILSGLDRFDSGDIECFGKNMKNFSSRELDDYRNSCVGFVFQEYHLIPELNVGDNIALALQLQGQSGAKEKILAVLKQVDLEGYEKRNIDELSGGQKQRVAIARALVKDPKIIFADEPTGALDSNTGESILQILKAVSAEKLVILVTHDREFAEKYGDRVIELADGLVIRDSNASYQYTETEKELPLRRSRMPIRSALKIGCSNFRFHPVRLISTVVLSVLAFVILGVALITSTVTFSDFIYDYLCARGISSSILVKIENEMQGRFTQEERATIRQQFQADTVPIRYKEILLEDHDEVSDVLPYMIAQVSEESLAYLRMPYEGRLPTAGHEIAISKALADALGGSCLETKLKIQGTEYLVTAIIDTGGDSGDGLSLQNALFVYNVDAFGKGTDLTFDSPCELHMIDGHPISISKIIKDNDSLQKYKLNEKFTGIYLPVAMIPAVLNSISCTIEYQGTYYRTYGQLFDAILREESDAEDMQSAYLATFDKLIAEYDLPPDFRYPFQSPLYGFAYQVTVDGFYFQEDPEANNPTQELILHDSIFDKIRSTTEGQCDILLIPVNEAMKEYLNKASVIQVMDPIVSELHARENNIATFTEIAKILAIIFTVFSALLLVTFISQSLVDKTKTIGILRAFGSDNLGVLQIFLLEGLTIGFAVFLISILSIFGVCEILNMLFADFIGFDVDFWNMDLLVGGFLFLLSIVFSFIGCVMPIIKLVRMHPTEIIRSDI